MKKKRKLWDWRYISQEKRNDRNWALVLFGSLVMFFFFQRYLVSMSLISEESMSPTLSDGEYYLANKYIYHFSPPQRGDIVALRETKYAADSYVKRVIGLPGETLLIEGGNVYINGQALAEPYAYGTTEPNVGPLTLEEDSYFVMGDNRPYSYDSRHFGPVSNKNIDGKIDPARWFPFK